MNRAMIVTEHRRRMDNICHKYTLSYGVLNSVERVTDTAHLKQDSSPLGCDSYMSLD
jgi:hypothetical protein